MNRYGVVAVNAVHSMLSGEEVHPLIAWKKAAAEAFGEGTWAQRKGCPKNAFLGLCEEGLVQGIKPGSYAERSTSQKNKNYAVKAVQILRDKPELVDDKLGLWREVMNGVEKSHNYQMDVVLSLWNNNLIVGNYTCK
ncbi:hypothetical protein BBD42_21570 [Paenibacillus sp. BIHB 4019]|uniref:Uncharacterized protein n=1 Tax=Paenibacillus sp. BIHB 4019 TaxID=1870819 RepID=A0A1B2DM30_9BACL|nr:hypothetical protein [Paenibacillus sp. BIHB 4019]ANY68766.1 hypothetical protein BBD42_21570 [Paenibacillus sp. BIHB 4019]